jgi:predicted transposase/invertase (TIGR01784 family)
MTTHSNPNPHDLFFKRSFSRPEVVRGFIERFVPADVVACLDLDTLEIQSGSFVDPELNATFSDLVFTVQSRGMDGKTTETTIYLLFEHKSAPDRLIAFQMLKYVVRIGEQRLRDGLPLCCVIPLVVYHGDRQWRVSRTLADVIECDEPLRRYIPKMPIELFDLSSYTDEQLRDKSLLQATLILLKYIHREELFDRLVEVFQLLASLENEQDGLECIRTVLAFLASSTVENRWDEVGQIARNSFQTKGNQIMETMADVWLKQGLEQGLEQGIEQGLEQGELIGKIRVLQEMLGLPVTSNADLRQQSLVELEETVIQLRQQFK